jgi:hypothetical protein
MDNDKGGSEIMQVSLGGRKWPVPVLAAKQNKVIDPLILRLLPVFAEWQTDRTSALTKLGSTQYDALLEIAFVAIGALNAALTREAFMDLPVTLPELISAFSVIAVQTGIFQKENDLGEAVGAGSPLKDFPTGIVSSPIPAT